MSERVHELKTWPDEFMAVRTGFKTHEFRKDDRDYCAGDILNLREWSPERGYSGDSVSVRVTYIGRDGFGIPEGYAVLSIRLLDQREAATAWVPIHGPEDLPKDGTWWLTWFDDVNNRVWVNRGEPVSDTDWTLDIGLTIHRTYIQAVMPTQSMPDPYRKEPKP
jgi:hypothetical protein